MTEPPQPPNQPPTPSGYGHLPGPPQPGYGHPPQGANPYAQQPPYGQQPPQQQQPQQPPQLPQYPPQQPPPGYAHPQQPPTVPSGQALGAPGTPPKKKTTALIAAAVAGTLVLGVGAYFAFFRDGGADPKQPVAQPSTPADPKPSASAEVDKGDGTGNGAGGEDLNAGRQQGEDKVLWLKTAKIDGPGMGVESEGQWVVGDTVVKSVWKSLTGYGVADGKEKWTLPFPAAVCSVTPQTTADNKTVVMYRESEAESAACTQMRVVDLASGKEVWSKEVPKEQLFDIFTSPAVAITGDTVAISRGGTASAFKISNGDKLFASTQAEGCKPGSYAAGNGKMVGLATCLDEDKTAEVQSTDPVTGKRGWTYRVPKSFKVSSVYSLDPLVLELGNEATKEIVITVIGPDGKQGATLSAEGKFPIGCGDTGIFRSFSVCSSAVVDGGTLHLATARDAVAGNAVVAFDLSTGKEKWRTPAGAKRTLTPLKAVGGQLIAYRQAEYDKGGEILSVPAGGATPTALLRNPSGAAAPVESSFHTPRLDYVDGRFFLSVSRLQARGKDEKFLMVFGK
ncbi:PQQ-binding-like beta-propeller repeat protein [Streptomyces sp. NPDC058622]|uniref:outer membrane protein assembly factor BamB family protein n=1 Tax=Streptomyces sp. NPDC058622 TaxID=3346562 RepID=UPI00365EA110